MHTTVAGEERPETLVVHRQHCEQESGDVINQAMELEHLAQACWCLFESRFEGCEGYESIAALLRILMKHSATCSSLIIDQDDDLRALRRELGDK